MIKQEIKDQIIELRKSGCSYKNIANITKVGISTVVIHTKNIKIKNNSWSQQEIDFLKINYPIYGPEYCSKTIKRTYKQIALKAFSLGIRFRRNMNDPINKRIIKKLDGTKVFAYCKRHGETVHYNCKTTLRCILCKNEQLKKYNKTDKGKLSRNKYRHEYYKKYYKNEIVNFVSRIRNRLNACFHGRTVHFRDLGYSGEELRNHINSIKEQQNNKCPICLMDYEKCKMNIEHIVPLAKAKSKEEIINLFQLSNLSVMCGNCNSSKYNKDLNKWLKNKDKL